jgi:hypothetical protein
VIPLLFALHSDVVEPETRFRNAVSTQPLALLGDGAVLQYERLVSSRFSLAGSVGARFGASGDFASRAYSLGTELRYWLRPDAMRGFYFFGRVDGTLTSVQLGDRSLGSAFDLAETVGAGYRFVLFDRIEVTPYLGGGALTTFDGAGRLSPYTRAVVKLGLTVGVVF